ncbi:MAG TPA: TonB family protein [Bryobacteraceae bacterium]|nr:TonB family protein [Bryobacteraceae bacterium]
MRPRFLFVTVVVALGIAIAQDPPNKPPPPYHIGNGVSPPQVIEKQEPQYTDEARIAKMEGIVALGSVVNAEGVPMNLRVLRPMGLGLDENAMRTVSAWRFKPGMKEGSPVAVVANIEVNYRLLLDSRVWHLARAAFTQPTGATRARIVKAKYPGPSGPAERATVTVSFDVDEKGRPTNFQAEKSSDPKWESEVIALVSKGWEFEPGVKGGQPIAVHATFDFARGGN